MAGSGPKWRTELLAATPAAVSALMYVWHVCIVVPMLASHFKWARDLLEGLKLSFGRDRQRTRSQNRHTYMQLARMAGRTLLQASYLTGRKLTAHRFCEDCRTEKWGKWG